MVLGLNGMKQSNYGLKERKNRCLLKRERAGKSGEYAAPDRIYRVCGLAGLFLLLFFAAAYFFTEKEESNGAETLTDFPVFSASSYAAGEFQEELEQAAKDQFVLHEQAVAWNADLNASVKSLAKKSFSLLRGKEFREELTPFGEVYRMYGSSWLTDLPYAYEEETARSYRRKAEEINAFAEAHPDLKIFVYYCTRAEDLNWFDDAEGLQSYPWYELLKEALSENISFDRMKFRDFDEYKSRMYRTDHHWNNTGAAAGYADILRMMSGAYEMGMARSILKTNDYGQLLWTGSRGRECGRSIRPEEMDVFAADEYILPPHTTLFGDKEQEIGLKKVYDGGAVNREIGFDQYLNYYGFESDTITLRYEEGEHNLLMIGDSFARAVREPLSSHFKTTVFVNFRILGQVDLEQLLEDNDIDTVLLMGQQDAWSGYFLDGTQTGGLKEDERPE